jgi:hypothetical protein
LAGAAPGRGDGKEKDPGFFASLRMTQGGEAEGVLQLQRQFTIDFAKRGDVRSRFNCESGRIRNGNRKEAGA